MNSPMFGAKAAIENTIAKYPAALQWGLEAPFNFCALLIAGSGDVSTLRLMLEHGFRHDLVLSWKDINGLEHGRPWQRTMFRTAIVARLLGIAKGVPILEATVYGNAGSALHAAAFFGNLGCVDVLLAAGADASSTVHAHLKCCTPLHLAAYKGHEAVALRLLGAAPAAAGVRDGRTRRTPAQWARRAGHLRLAERLTDVLRA